MSTSANNHNTGRSGTATEISSEFEEKIAELKDDIQDTVADMRVAEHDLMEAKVLTPFSQASQQGVYEICARAIDACQFWP